MINSAPNHAHEPQCPQCGATLHNTANTMITCEFCEATLRLTRDLLELQIEVITPGAAYLIEIRRLLQDGRKLEAIKTYQLSTGMNLPDATRVVDALENGEPPPDLKKVLQRTAIRVPGAPAWLRALKAIGIIAAVLVLVVLVMQISIRLSGAFDPAIEAINADPIAQEAFGRPINPGAIIIGIMLPSGDYWRADYRVPIYGSQRDGTLIVTGNDSSKGWKLTSVAEYVEDGRTVTIRLKQ